MPMVTRDAIQQALREALEPLDYVYAMWEGGSAATGRSDEWSDIDLQVDAEDDRTEDVFATAEDVLRKLSPIDLVYRLPEPTWHGHSQRLYRLRDASPFLMVDFVVMRHSSKEKFLQPEIHGNQ